MQHGQCSQTAAGSGGSVVGRRGFHQIEAYDVRFCADAAEQFAGLIIEQSPGRRRGCGGHEGNVVGVNIEGDEGLARRYLSQHFFHTKTVKIFGSYDGVGCPGFLPVLTGTAAQTPHADLDNTADVGHFTHSADGAAVSVFLGATGHGKIQMSIKLYDVDGFPDLIKCFCHGDGAVSYTHLTLPTILLV